MIVCGTAENMPRSFGNIFRYSNSTMGRRDFVTAISLAVAALVGSVVTSRTYPEVWSSAELLPVYMYSEGAAIPSIVEVISSISSLVGRRHEL